jgi:creatinine amidohydrolase
MTQFFPYDQLTWPEAADLPRTTPLIIPFGEGYDLSRLADALGQPEQVGLLPPIPFGWRGSGLTVPEPLLSAVLHNLLNSLREDGFTQVYALIPQDMSLGLGAEAIVLPHSTQFQPADPLPDASNIGKVVVIPIGHTEQHGYHLPLSTDNLIIEAIGSGTASAVPDLAVALPTFPYGVSTHRQSFAGTLNVGGRAFEDFWLGVLDVLVGRGFDRFYLMSGHGGNCSFLVNVVKYAGERYRRIFCATAWLHTSGHIAGPVVQETRRSARGGMGHAGELETAMILALRPELVYMERAIDEIEFVSTPSYFMDWIEGGELVANPPWDDDTATGAYGAGSLATAENGRRWLAVGIEEKAAHIREIHQQHTRREERREAGLGLWGRGKEIINS